MYWDLAKKKKADRIYHLFETIKYLSHEIALCEENTPRENSMEADLAQAEKEFFDLIAVPMPTYIIDLLDLN